MKIIISTVIMIIVCAIPAFAQKHTATSSKISKKEKNEGPIRIKLIGTDGGKPPFYYVQVYLSIQNKSNKKKWYIFPRYINKVLKPDGIFTTHTNWSTRDIIGRKFSDSMSTNQIVDVELLADNGFIAFCLAPKTTISLDYYVFEGMGEDMYSISKTEAWEVNQLMVNGKTELSKWLPYNVICSEYKYIGMKDNFSNDYIYLNWDDLKKDPRADHPKEGVRYINAVGIKKMGIKLER